MAMDRIQILLVALPLFLFTFDILNLFVSHPPPPKPKPTPHRHHQIPKSQPSILPQTLDFPSQSNGFGGGIGVGVGHAVSIDFCSSCSYKGTAVTMKNMLETQFPGLHVALENYPPSPPKRILSKFVPVVQIGVIGIIIAGDQIFPRLGMIPPPWFYSLRANRFGTISATWLFGNFLQSSLQSSGAFEVYFDGEPLFSKLKEQRFPGEIELRDLVGKRLAGTTIVNGGGANTRS